ncbi:hypothetical protein GCM10009601_45580 [Streptomyces thermospinosisporus]|uniref:Glycosyltransferase n=1 Tax=Streptomyces thermospinosisporus TaxID=161482 RepID=A0ABP4JW81_9ACTN
MGPEPASDPIVSVIIPVYNAGDHLTECLQSIAGQSIGFGHVEIIAVDDGSTDGSGALLDEWARRHPGRVRVVHQENSGAPGGPRNRAIGMATGEFLFFADPDDYLGAQALERLVAAARRDGADVVLGRIRGVGRKAPVTPFRKNVQGGDVHTTRAVWSLTAHKLFRRSLVMEHGLRFAERLRLAEEQIFVVAAYLLARSVSVVADYDCYYLVRREGAAHLTQQEPEPGPFYANVRAVLDLVAEHVPPGRKRDDLIHRWVVLEILGRFNEPFAGLPEDTQALHVRLAGRLLDDYASDELIARLPPLARLRCLLIRQGLVEELAALSTLAPRPKAKQPPKPQPKSEHQTKATPAPQAHGTSRPAPRRRTTAATLRRMRRWLRR